MQSPRIGITGIVREWAGASRAGVNAAYVESVLRAGGVPLILPPLIGAAAADAVAGGVDGLLFTGGEDVDPAFYDARPSPRLGTVSRERDLFELALFRSARERGIPVLGICRGIQIINVALGGTLWQDLPSERPSAVAHNPGTARDTPAHRIRLRAESRAARAVHAVEMHANSFHHQAIRDLASGLVASGWADDDVIEAVEGAPGDPWLLAVQWHPEEMTASPSAPDRGLFAALVAEARSAVPAGR